MKIILLLLLCTACKTSVAQYNLSLIKKQIQQTAALQPANELTTGNKNYIAVYLQNEMNKKIAGNIFHHTASKNALKEPALFRKEQIHFTIDQSWLDKKATLQPGQLRIRQIEEIAAGLFYGFFGQYDIENKIIH